MIVVYPNNGILFFYAYNGALTRYSEVEPGLVIEARHGRSLII